MQAAPRMSDPDLEWVLSPIMTNEESPSQMCPDAWVLIGSSCSQVHNQE